MNSRRRQLHGRRQRFLRSSVCMRMRMNCGTRVAPARLELAMHPATLEKRQPPTKMKTKLILFIITRSEEPSATLSCHPHVNFAAVRSCVLQSLACLQSEIATGTVESAARTLRGAERQTGAGGLPAQGSTILNARTASLTRCQSASRLGGEPPPKVVNSAL